MIEPKKSVRIIMFIGLIALNILLLSLVLQRTHPDLTPQAKMASPTSVPVAMENCQYLPLAFTPYEGAIVMLPGDGVYYERDQDVQIVHVLGEVLNNTPTTVNKVMIEAVLNLKSGGQTTLRGFPLVGSLARGERACFDLYVMEAKEVESYAIKVLSYATGGSMPGGLAPMVTNAGYDAQNGWYSVEGMLSSTEATAIMNDLRVVVTLLDSSGRILGCEQSYVRSQTEEVNAPVTFKVLFMNRDFSQGDSYSLAIAGTAQ